jgi:hypothetical protein
MGVGVGVDVGDGTGDILSGEVSSVGAGGDLSAAVIAGGSELQAVNNNSKETIDKKHLRTIITPLSAGTHRLLLYGAQHFNILSAT